MTKDNNEHWDGFKGGLAASLKIIREIKSKTYKPTAKTIQAEEWVDNYIQAHKYHPTYKEISDGLKISKTAAFHRCRTFRQKLNNL